MRNAIAEWILSQAAPPEREKTIVGDLLEAQLGPVEFWFAVLRATASIAVHQPRRVLAWLLWVLCEASFYALLAWLLVRFHLHPSKWLLLAFVVLLLAVGRTLGWHRARTSTLPSLLFWTWFLVYDGWPMTGALLVTVWAAVLGWRTQWKRRQSDEDFGSDRSIAG